MTLGYYITLAGLLVLPLGSVSARTQSVPFRFHPLSLSDGLPHSIVNHVMQDSEGFMWFSTHGGLSRYDGYEFQTFVPQADSSSVLYYEIDDTYEDAHRNLWIRYAAGGISRYNLVTGIFSHYRSHVGPGSIAGDVAPGPNRANQVFTDRQGRSWFRTTQGLSRYVDSIDCFVSYTHRPGDSTSLPHDRINYLMQDSRERVWVATDDGLGFFREDTQTFENYDADESGLGHHRVLSVYEDAQHYLWVGTQDGLSRSVRPLTAEGLLRFVTYRPVDEENHRTNAIFQITPGPPGTLWLATERGVVKAQATGPDVRFSTYLDEAEHVDVTGVHYIADVYQDSQGHVWVRARPEKRGFFRYDPEADAFVTLGKDGTQGLPTDAISCLYEGRSGLLWVGAWRTGVLQLDLHAQPFQHYQSNPEIAHDVYSIYRRDTSLWIGTADGLYRHHLPSGRTQKLSYTDRPSSGGQPKIVGALAYDTLSHSLWAGYYDYKISRLSLDDRATVNYHYHNNQTDRYQPWSVRTICPDPSGRLWVGAATGGLHYYDRASDRFYEYPLPDSTVRWINHLSLQSDSLLWISTIRQGLYRLNLRSGQVVSWVSGGPGGLPTNNVSAVASVGQRVWVGTAQGLAELDTHGSVVATYTTASGLCNNDVKAIVPDHRGRLWISTNHGLSCFDPSRRSFANYYTQDGLTSNEFNLGAAFQDDTGTIYLGSSQGVIAFNPDRIQPVSEPIPIHIVDVRINNVSLHPGDTVRGKVPLRQSSPFTRRITLPFRANNIMLQFAALNYRSPMASRYEYRLVGFDAHWVSTSATHRRATYTNLAPGSYRFEVRDSHQPLSATSVEVIVLPPWWGTGWFRLLMVLFVVAVIGGGNRWRHRNLLRQREVLRQTVAIRTASLRQQSDELKVANRTLCQKQNEEVEQARLIKRMAEEVHRSDQLKIRFFTQMSHEFRTPLTLILGPLQMGVSTKHLPRPVVQQLRLMKRNAERLFTLINQLIDLNRVEEGYLRLQVAEVDVVAKTRQVAEAFQPMARQMDITFRYEASVSRYWGWLDYDQYDKILYNLLSNAFKFTPTGGSIGLAITVVSTEQGAFLHVTVQNSGIGLRPEDIEKVFDHFYTAHASPHQSPGSGIGLALVKQLTQLHKGTIEALSDGEGTTFQLVLPISRHHFEPHEVGQRRLPAEWQSPHLIAPLTDAPVKGEVARPTNRELPRVLVVDDHPDMCAFISSVLSDEYEVIAAYDGLMAWEQLAVVDPALIITDVMMPRMDGLQLCERVKAQSATSHIPVILLTAKATQEDEIAGLRVGACDYLRKPFRVAVLQLKVKNLLAAYQRARQQISQGDLARVDPSALHPSDRAFLENIEYLMDENLAEPVLTADFLARQISISKSHLYKKVKSLSGVSVHIFIRNHRIRKAADQLRQGQPVSEVAYGVGFNSLSYFTRCFSDFYGLPPRAYQTQRHTKSKA